MLVLRWLLAKNLTREAFSFVFPNQQSFDNKKGKK